MIAPDLIARRRAFRLPGYATLADVGMDGEYVSPLQLAAQSATGPVLLASHWLDVGSARRHLSTRRACGYLPGIVFNRVVDRALAGAGLSRAGVYMTQVFHLLPLAQRSSHVPDVWLDASFQAITRHELAGRTIVALGAAAAATCRRHGIEPHQAVDHPSARGPGRTIDGKAAQLSAALRAVAASAAQRAVAA